MILITTKRGTIMNFEIVNKLIDDPLFRYDRNDDSLILQGTYKKELHSKAYLPHFLEGSSKLLEKQSKAELKKVWYAEHQNGDLVYIEIPMLNAAQKYELFAVRGIYAEKQNAIIGIMKNIESRKRAFLDPLTGLLNRNGVEETSQQILDNTSLDHKSALYLIDLDNFKEVNDTKGHLLGDELIKTVAESLQKTFSENALVARIGGDEFVVLFYNIADQLVVADRADKLCKSLEAEFAQKEYHVTLSIGIGFSKTPITYNTLFAQADAALYAMKSQGKNGFRVFTPQMKQERYMSKRSVGNGKNGAIVQESNFIKYHCLINNVIDIINQTLPPKATIEAVSKQIVDTFHVTRAYASCYMPDGSRLGKSYFYAANDDPNIKPKLALKRDEYIKNYNEDGIFFCTDILKANEPLRSELIRMQVKSLLQILVYDQLGNVVGTVGINNCTDKRLWVQEEIDMIQTVAKLLTGTIMKLQKESVEEAE